MKKKLKAYLVAISLVVALEADVKHFSNINQAVDEFVVALEKKDAKALESLFTKKYQYLVESNEINAEEIDAFLSAYKKSNHLVSFDAQEVYIEVGKYAWTFPIPLCKDKNGWAYNIAIGLENIKTRAIGRHELETISALQNYTSFTSLQSSAISEIYSFTQEENGDIIAIPKEYNVNAITSFVLKKDGKIYEADLGEGDYTFDNRFRLLN